MTVNICGIPYTVKDVEDTFGEKPHFGQIDFLKCEIKIHKELSGKNRSETLCHEILHGIFTHLGRYDMSGDEQFVQELANAINQTFIINEQ